MITLLTVEARRLVEYRSMRTELQLLKTARLLMMMQNVAALKSIYAPEAGRVGTGPDPAFQDIYKDLSRYMNALNVSVPPLDLLTEDIYTQVELVGRTLMTQFPDLVEIIRLGEACEKLLLYAQVPDFLKRRLEQAGIDRVFDNFKHNATKVGLAATDIEAWVSYARASGKYEILGERIMDLVRTQLKPRKEATIKVENVVGPVTVGDHSKVWSTVNQQPIEGFAQLVAALNEIRSAVERATDLNADKHRELVSQINYVASQAAKPAAEREPHVIKAVLSTLEQTLTNVASTATIWSTWGQTILAYFGL